MSTKLLWGLCILLSLCRVALHYIPVEHYLSSTDTHSVPHLRCLWYHPYRYQYLDDFVEIFTLVAWPVIIARTKRVPLNWCVAVLALICSPVIGLCLNGSHRTWSTALGALSVFGLVTLGTMIPVMIVRELRAGSLKWATFLYRVVNSPPRPNGPP
jgi:hypothetical protein